MPAPNNKAFLLILQSQQKLDALLLHSKYKLDPHMCMTKGEYIIPQTNVQGD
jgi:hypothetical protein